MTSTDKIIEEWKGYFKSLHGENCKDYKEKCSYHCKHSKITDWLREKLTSQKSQLKEMVKEMKPGSACSSGMCGHTEEPADQKKHGQYLGYNEAIDDIINKIDKEL